MTLHPHEYEVGVRELHDRLSEHLERMRRGSQAVISAAARQSHGCRQSTAKIRSQIWIAGGSSCPQRLSAALAGHA